MYPKILLLFFSIIICSIVFAQGNVKLKHRDRKKDVELVTNEGNIIIRLSDSTPMHRNNFLKLVKYGYFDSLLFHRVIRNFMIQSGDPNSKRAMAHQPLGEGGPDYTIPSEFRPGLFHRKGAVAAAREGDNVNPAKSSSGSQFYIVQGRTFTDRQLDSIEVVRLNGRKLPHDRREFYKTIGGTPQLDGNYTVFGQVVKGLDIVDKIAATPTSKAIDRDRPLTDMRILSAHLVKRDKKLHFSF